MIKFLVQESEIFGCEGNSCTRTGSCLNTYLRVGGSSPRPVKPARVATLCNFRLKEWRGVLRGRTSRTLLDKLTSQCPENTFECYWFKQNKTKKCLRIERGKLRTHQGHFEIGQSKSVLNELKDGPLTLVSAVDTETLGERDLLHKTLSPQSPAVVRAHHCCLQDMQDSTGSFHSVELFAKSSWFNCKQSFNSL